MSATSSVAAKALEFKGRMMTLTVLRVNSDQSSALESALDAQFARTPEFFRSLPVLIESDCEALDLAHLVKLLRARSLVPVAVYRPSAKLMQAAEAAGLGVVSDPRGTRPAPQQQEPPQAPVKRPTTRLLTQPVRSGQQIYARGTDLIVVSTVSPGAEVLADGSIHVYGALRGRALAGAQGDESARIFCRDLDAELLAIAGRYRVSEDLGDDVRRRAVQVALQEESLIISRF